MKIVIVDDDILVSSALKTILEAGGEVEVTGTGQDGKDAVRLYDESDRIRNRDHVPNSGTASERAERKRADI